MSRARGPAVVLMLASLAVPAGAQARAESNKYALLVGVKSYDHDRLGDLKYTERDVEELGAALGRIGFRVTVLSSTRGNAKPEAKPTIANIRGELKRILGAVTKHDTVLVALAGHGLQLKVKVGDAEKEESFFCPADAKPRDTNDMTELGKSMIALSGLFKELDDSGAGVKLLLVDACRNDPLLGRMVSIDSLPRPPRGTAALFSCKSGERAFETDKLGGGHGVFFHFVIQGLQGEARNRRGEVTWASLADYVTEKVSDQVPVVIGGGARQTPQEIRNLTGKSPVLAALIARVHLVGKSRLPTTDPAPAKEKIAPDQAAEAQALFQRGRVLFEGLQGRVDLREAARLFFEAGNKDHVLAATALATMYFNGIGVPVDRERACKIGKFTAPLVKKLAESGDCVAMNLLGFTYQNAMGVEKNEAEGFQWTLKAARMKYALAQANVGLAYATGQGVKQDCGEAMAWLQKSAELKSAYGQYALGLMCFNGKCMRPNPTETARLFELSARQGFPLAQYDLAGCYAMGFGRPIDRNQAIYWYRQAANQGHTGAQEVLRKLGVIR
jgi:TPR repeat protein